MICAVYNCIYLPVEQSFLKGDECFVEFLFIDGFNLFVDFLYFVDIVLNFRTTYQNLQTGEEVQDIKDI